MIAKMVRVGQDVDRVWTMDESEVVQKAEAVAAQRIVVESLGMMNVPDKAEDRVKLDAAYMVAKDKLFYLMREYDDAMRQWVACRSNRLA